MLQSGNRPQWKVSEIITQQKIAITCNKCHEENTESLSLVSTFYGLHKSTLQWWYPGEKALKYQLLCVASLGFLLGSAALLGEKTDPSPVISSHGERTDPSSAMS